MLIDLDQLLSHCSHQFPPRVSLFCNNFLKFVIFLKPNFIFSAKTSEQSYKFVIKIRDKIIFKKEEEKRDFGNVCLTAF